MRLFLSLLLLSSTVSFALGLILPLVQLDKLYFLTETPSLIAIIQGLWDDEEVLLAALVAVFSILFPSLKLLTVQWLALLPQGGEAKYALKFLDLAGKWSMMDVLLVALVIFSAKTSGLAKAFALPGLWFYAAAVLGSALSAYFIKRQH